MYISLYIYIYNICVSISIYIYIFIYTVYLPQLYIIHIKCICIYIYIYIYNCMYLHIASIHLSLGNPRNVLPLSLCVGCIYIYIYIYKVTYMYVERYVYGEYQPIYHTDMMYYGLHMFANIRPNTPYTG